MLVIRLARAGRHKYPTYRIVAAESSRAATGKFVEILGHYNPHTKELSLKKDETQARLQNGAQPSNSVIKLLQREKVELPKWVALKTKSKAPKKEPVVEEPKTAPAAEATDETLAEESATEEKVAEAATENEDAVEEKGPDTHVTETAEVTAEAADKAEATEEAGDAEPQPEEKPAA